MAVRPRRCEVVLSAETSGGRYANQFTQAGYRAVEDVLGVRVDDAVPSRTTEVFLAHKDAMLAHLREFSSELPRDIPKLVTALASDVDRMMSLAVCVDERIFRPPADWRHRWAGLVGRFLGSPSEAERLQAGTVSAIAGVLALLRWVTESRQDGVSRESRLRHLAAWFTGIASDEAAHAEAPWFDQWLEGLLADGAATRQVRRGEADQLGWVAEVLNRCRRTACRCPSSPNGPPATPRR